MKHYKIKYKNTEDGEMKSKVFEYCENEGDALKRFTDSFSFTIEEITSGDYLPIIKDIIEVKEYDIRMDFVGSAQKTVHIYAENEEEALAISDEHYDYDYDFDDYNWEHQWSEVER